MGLRRNTHHGVRLIFHFVWIPKYRNKVFAEPYRSSLKAIIGKMTYDDDIELHGLEVPEDHVHRVGRSCS